MAEALPRVGRMSTLLAACALTQVAAAGEIVSIEVAHEAGSYTLASVSRYSAPPWAVYAVLADYDGFARLSSAIVDSGVLADPAPDGATRVHTMVRGCVLFFCRDVRRVERLELVPGEQIVARVEPQHSDFSEGVSRWRFQALPDGGTEIDFHMHMTPRFRVPPVIGPALVKRRLQRDGVRAVARIDALALEYAAAAAGPGASGR